MKVLARNRRAKFDYDIKNTLLAGIVLGGAEVKSVKQGSVSLKGSHIITKNGELYLLNTHISPYKQAGNRPHEETRPRKLLVHKKELKQLESHKQAGLSLVPLSVGVQKGLIKVEIGVGRGLKKYDKRMVLKKRQDERSMRQSRE